MPYGHVIEIKKPEQGAGFFLVMALFLALQRLLLSNAVNITAAQQNFPAWHCHDLMLWEYFCQ